MGSRFCVCKVEDKETLDQAANVKRLSGLPADLLEQSSRRLGMACLIYAACYSLAYFGPACSRWIQDGTMPSHLPTWRTGVALVAILLAVGLFVLSRRGKIRASVLLDLGLGFEVIGGLGIAMVNFWGAFSEWTGNPYEAQHLFLGIPWECVWIIIFPLIAPNTPRKTFVAGMLTASMGLLVLIVSRAAGATSNDVPLSFFLPYFIFTTYLCAIIAFGLNGVILRYKVQIKKARELGQYEMVDKLGEGGMGEVWRAKHRMLARPAAIKLIRPKAIEGEWSLIRRFEREARATAALRSVHTIEVYDFGTNEEGAFYYVMELLDGLDLDSFVKRFGPIPSGRAIWWLRQACHSLMEAHQTGLVHRDVKPANIFACRYGLDLDFIKVLDFGLVKRPDDSEEDLSRLTQQGTSFGTPDFMPPEMAMGAAEIDGRADIYALGCVAYWLVTGEQVFEGDTALATVLHHVKTEPVPPSQRCELEIPDDFEKVILDCLAKEPADRPQSAHELDQRLATCGCAAEWNGSKAEQWWDLHLPGTCSG